MASRYGPAFAAEIGEPRGRREFNVLGDTVNTAARLMSRAEVNEILITAEVEQAIRQQFDCVACGTIALKGKSAPLTLFTLNGRAEAQAREKLGAELVCSYGSACKTSLNC